MPVDINKLRNRNAQTAEDLQKRREIIKDAAIRSVNDSAYTLTALNNSTSLNAEQSVQIENLANKVAEAVVAEVADPVKSFLAVCKARNIPDRKIKNIVCKIDELFNLSELDARDGEDEYAIVIKAVACYLEANPNLYNDIASLH